MITESFQKPAVANFICFEMTTRKLVLSQHLYTSQMLTFKIVAYTALGHSHTWHVFAAPPPVIHRLYGKTDRDALVIVAARYPSAWSMNSSSLNYVLTFRVRITPPSTDCVNKPSLNVFLKALDQPDVMDSMVVGLCILMAYT